MALRVVDRRSSRAEFSIMADTFFGKPNITSVIWQQRARQHIITVQSHFERISHREKNLSFVGGCSVSELSVYPEDECRCHAQPKLRIGLLQAGQRWGSLDIRLFDRYVVVALCQTRYIAAAVARDPIGFAVELPDYCAPRSAGCRAGCAPSP